MTLPSKLWAPRHLTLCCEYGWDWPSVAHTMIGEKRLANVRYLAESVLGDGIEGDFIETGVWRGGACILMRGVLNVHAVKDRCVWLADSFEGLPPPMKRSIQRMQVIQPILSLN